MLKNFIFIAFGFVFFGANILLTSCEKDMAIALNNDNVEALNLSSFDSLGIQITNINMPNIPTSGAGPILLGSYVREGVGRLSVAPYFQVEPESYTFSDIPDHARFDSIQLILRPHRNLQIQGDTTAVHRVRAYQLSERLQTTTLQPGGINNTEIPYYVQAPAIFGQRSFALNSTPLGELTYTPRPRSGQRLAIRLGDAFGKDLFDKMMMDDSRVLSAESFTEYMHGFAVIPDEENASVIAYNDTIQAAIHYSYVGDGGLRTAAQKNLVIRNYNLKYNKFTSDRTGTPFQALSVNTPLPGTQTAGVGIVEAGSGAAVRIDVPGLREFLQTPGIAVNKMELEVEVNASQDLLFPLPLQTSAPALYLANSNGIALSFVRAPFTNNIQTGQYFAGNNTGQNPRYTFNLIEYVRVVNSETTGPQHLVMSFPPETLVGTANSVVLATQDSKPKIKLNILYTKFN